MMLLICSILDKYESFNWYAEPYALINVFQASLRNALVGTEKANKRYRAPLWKS